MTKHPDVFFEKNFKKAIYTPGLTAEIGVVADASDGDG